MSDDNLAERLSGLALVHPQHTGLMIRTMNRLDAYERENTRLRNWANTLEATMRAQGVCLCTFAQKTVGDGCQVCEPPPSHKGED